MEKKVRFICVGAQKAGTSTLHDILQQHPAINFPKRKETHFFRDDEKYNAGVKNYFDLFEDKPGAEYYGEIDPEYLYFEHCAQRIKETFGDLKILAILRNPVDRAYSHYLMTKSRGLEDLSFNEAIQSEKDRLASHFDHINYSYLARGRYSAQLERFEDIFGKENVKTFLFDDFISDPEAIVAQIFEFVGMEPFGFDYKVKSNVASEAKSEKVRDFVYKPNKIKKWVGKLIPSKKLKSDIMSAIAARNKKEALKVPIPPKVKQDIYQAYFEQEIERLETKLGKDLSAWKYEH